MVRGGATRPPPATGDLSGRHPQTRPIHSWTGSPVGGRERPLATTFGAPRPVRGRPAAPDHRPHRRARWRTPSCPGLRGGGGAPAFPPVSCGSAVRSIFRLPGRGRSFDLAAHPIRIRARAAPIATARLGHRTASTSRRSPDGSGRRASQQRDRQVVVAVRVGHAPLAPPEVAAPGDAHRGVGGGHDPVVLWADEAADLALG